jgi:hypothetical protein
MKDDATLTCWKKIIKSGCMLVANYLMAYTSIKLLLLEILLVKEKL